MSTWDQTVKKQKPQGKKVLAVFQSFKLKMFYWKIDVQTEGMNYERFMHQGFLQGFQQIPRTHSKEFQWKEKSTLGLASG